MKKKELIKLGIIAPLMLTTALVVGCSYQEAPHFDTSNIPVEPSINYETIPYERVYEDSVELVEESDVSTEVEDELPLDEELNTGGLIDNGEVTEKVNFSNLQKVTVQRVVDGDTYLVKLNDLDVKVRLIGVDTPESVASDEYLNKTGKQNTQEGKDISTYMKGMLPAGTELYLEFDVSMYDKYDRVLAYAYFEDGEMIQEHLLKQGYAKVMTIEPNVAHSERFVELEQKAMEEGVGLWADYETIFDDLER